MATKDIRIRVDDKGGLEVIDPGFDVLPILMAINPGFEIRTAPLWGFRAPRFLKLKDAGSGVEPAWLGQEQEEKLWELHDALMDSLKKGETIPPKHADEMSLLDLKIEMAKRLLLHCTLCGRMCGVNRLAGEKGVCGLGTSALVVNNSTHIGEEAPINPSHLISLAGCGLQCRFCQQHELLDVEAIEGDPLKPSLWSGLPNDGARSLSFIGGNPDGSLYAILCFLAKAPADWKLPIVWNSHAYTTPETLRLLENVVDVYVPDFKFYHSLCAKDLANAPEYPALAQYAIKSMCEQNVPVIVRILVLPGHVECCHYPAIDYLSGFSSENLFLSVRGQYFPEWRITEKDRDLMRRPRRDEVESVRIYAMNAGLELVD
jgi:putative pyruvate formate lyase activating enzyme